MEGGKAEKFTVYQNPALSAALTANSLRPSTSTFLFFFFSLSSASPFLLFTFISREDRFIDNSWISHVSNTVAYLITKIIQIIVGLVFIGTVSALVKAIITSTNDCSSPHLSQRQLELLGVKPKTAKNLKSEPAFFGSTPSDPLFPIHRNAPSPNRSNVSNSPRSPSTTYVTPWSNNTSRTPVRHVRLSPTYPAKKEGELPRPMSMEEMIKSYKNLGIYPQIEDWRDSVRQWFSSVLLNPLVKKIENSHIQVMKAAERLGVSIRISEIGTKEWQRSFAMLEEERLLHQLHANLVQALGSPSACNLQECQLMEIRECLEAVTGHLRLGALMEGELVKGVLPQSSVRVDYTVQRIKELAGGTCLKHYEYVGSGEVYDKVNMKWSLELPTDSHLLLYLFCAFREHPKWMLHLDPTSNSYTQSCKTPLFLGSLPRKERSPDKYVAVMTIVPSVLRPGASVLVVGKQNPPLFALYWDEKLQFSLQGRTAFWDAISLLSLRMD